MAAPICFFWTIWRGRNRAVVEDVEVTAQGLKQSFAFALCSWARVLTDFDSCSETGFFVFFGDCIGVLLGLVC